MIVLMKRYRSDGNFALPARMICALAFMPLTELENAIAELAVFLPVELMTVLKYFDDTYVGSLLQIQFDGRTLRRDPKFPIDTWSSCPIDTIDTHYEQRLSNK